MRKPFDFSVYIVVLVKEWKFILLNCFVAGIVAVIYSFFIAEKQYVSSVTFLPPYEERSLLSFLPGGAGSIFSTDIIPQQIQTIFESKSLRRKVIKEFNLYEKYKLLKSENKFEQALRRLKKDIVLDIYEIGSLGVTKHISYTIHCYNTSSDTAFELAKYTFSILDSVIKEISVDKGKRNRIFVEKQLSINKNILYSLQETFERFQKENKVYNIPSQLKLTLDSYGNLKAKLLANEIKKKRLQKDYNNEYPIIMALEKENSVIKSNLLKMEKQTEPDVVIGFEKSAEMFPQYTNYLREIKVQNKLILLLTQQLEEAKLKEARDISPLKIVDLPFVPEYKARPKRILLCVGIVGVYLIFLFSIIFLQYVYIEFIRKTSLYHEIISIFKRQ